MHALAFLVTSLLALAPLFAGAAPCNMTKLGPVLKSPAMIQCTRETKFTIPNIAPYATGYDRVPDKVCLSTACGSAIQSIQALQLDECDLSLSTEDELLVGVTAKLYAQHLTPVFAICGNDTTRFGPTVTPDAVAIDASKACTQAQLASSYWGFQTELEQCAGVSLKSLVSPSSEGTNPLDMTEELRVCPACKALQKATKVIPTCALPSRNVSFRDYIEHAFAFCGAIETLRTTGEITSVLAGQLLNSSRECAFQSMPMLVALAPIQDGLLDNANCSMQVIDPSKPASAAICDVCPQVANFVAKIKTVPTCQTRFGQRYDEFLQSALGPCRGPQQTKPNTSSLVRNTVVNTTVIPVPTSNAVVWRSRLIVWSATVLCGLLW